MMWAWRRRKYIFTKDQSVKVKDKVRGHFLVTFWWFLEGFVIQCLKVHNHCYWGPSWIRWGPPEGPKVLLIPQNLFQIHFWRCFILLLKLPCLGAYEGPVKGSPGLRLYIRDHFEKSYCQKDIVENFIVIQLICAEKFVSQYFTTFTWTYT